MTLSRAEAAGRLLALAADLDASQLGAEAADLRALASRWRSRCDAVETRDRREVLDRLDRES